ncbi:MAG: hypothetical protein IKO35_01345 [Elusimicrobiaceae bacterium]|nr:hypothetical protein [Elusimicrobiaceae bacterium]
MNRIKNIIFLVLAGLVLLLIPLFLSKDEPIPVDFPRLTQQEVEAREEQKQQEAQTAAQKEKMRRIYGCQTDEDCIIVDKDPCGCLIGPQGVTAINALYTLEFNQMQSRSITKTCPDTPPSKARDCSPSAQAVCRANTCKIEY